MMTKAESETAIRHLATVWKGETGYVVKPGHYASFADFRSWLEAKHYSHYLNFRSSVDAEYVAEGWFEEEIKRSPY
jgi:hypothetical protein